MEFSIKNIIGLLVLLVGGYFAYDFIKERENNKKYTALTLAAYKHYRGTYNWLLKANRTDDDSNTWMVKLRKQAQTNMLSFEQQVANSLQWLCEHNPDYGPDCNIIDLFGAKGRK